MCYLDWGDVFVLCTGDKMDDVLWELGQGNKLILNRNSNNLFGNVKKLKIAEISLSVSLVWAWAFLVLL